MADPVAAGVQSDRFRNFLALALVLTFVAVLPLLVWKTVPADNKEIIVYMIGQLSGMAATAVAFYFVQKAGQDAIDAKRAETTGKMADAIVSAAASTPPVGGDAAAGANAVADAAADRAEEIGGER